MSGKYSPKIKVISALLGALLLFAGLFFQPIYFPTKDQALHDFQVALGIPSTNFYLDPLILAGDKVVPDLIEMVKDKKMIRREIGLRFLGNGSYRQALPTLEQILQDQTEKAGDRGTALQAIYLIDESKGRQYAQQYQGEIEYLGRIAKDILSGENYLRKRRTYWQALEGKLDDWCCNENDLNPT